MKTSDTDNIVIRLPGIDRENIDQATSDIERAAFLQFRLVHLESDAWVSELFAKGEVPNGFVIPDGSSEQYYVRDNTIKNKVDPRNLQVNYLS